MNKFKRLFIAAIFGLMITISLVFFMIALISLDHGERIDDNHLTTQVKVSSPPGLKPAREINSDSNKKHHQLPSKRKVNLPIDHKTLVSHLMAQEADGDQQDPLASPLRQQKLLSPGSQSQAVVKLAGLFNVIGADPKYPADALLAGQEGWVNTMIYLNQDGTVDHVDVLDSLPTGIFEESVVVAVSDWKIQLDKIREDQISAEYFHRFEFKITE